MSSINIVIIDGKGLSQATGKTLAAAGYICEQARGPLKLQRLLANSPVRVILWRAAGFTPELGEDLYSACSQYPAIPIIHLYSDNSIKGRLPAGLVPADSIPDRTRGRRLLEVISSVLGEDAAESINPPLTGTELAFRNVVARLSAKSPVADRNSGRHPQQEPYPTISTALNPVERVLLTGRDAPAMPNPYWGACTGLISRLTQRIFSRIGPNP